MNIFLLFGALLLLVASESHVQANNTGGSSTQFVKVQDGKFHVNGSEFKWIGTTAYWLPSLNTEQDIANTLQNISAAGIKVVKTWAFNDVEAVPINGTWFQLISNGTTTINDGPNGLQKLDMVLKHAQRLGLYIILSLTNNWNPREKLDGISKSIQGLESDVQARKLWDRDFSAGTNNSFPRNFLSNDYGGMDVYVRQFGLENHDEFYTNATLKELFKNYTATIASRYKDSPAVLSWELANDPRCGSSINASSSCEPQIVTQWHADVADHVQSVDPNHLISSGHQGFFCVECPKLFLREAPPPPPPPPPPAPPAPPQTSPTPGQVRRRALVPLTKARILQERREQWKKTRAAARLRGNDNKKSGGLQIRGKWVTTPTRRQEPDLALGSAFDGSQGVDGEDILAIPAIGFNSFQLFPDQNLYGVNDPSLSLFDNMVTNGVKWINFHAEAAQRQGKPAALNGFGLVTQENAQNFVPFNTSTPLLGQQRNTTQTPIGITNTQRDSAYQQWIDAAISAGLQGAIQYQWGQTGLTTQPGTTISPNVNGPTESPNNNEAGQSPNDGYSTNGIGQLNITDILTRGASQIGRVL